MLVSVFHSSSWKTSLKLSLLTTPSNLLTRPVESFFVMVSLTPLHDYMPLAPLGTFNSPCVQAQIPAPY